MTGHRGRGRKTRPVLASPLRRKPIRAVVAPLGGVVKLVNTAALEAAGPFPGKKISALASSTLVPATFILPRHNLLVHQALAVGRPD